MLGFRLKSHVNVVSFRRLYRVLAIETSCDDTCCAIIDRKEKSVPAEVLWEGKSTLNSVDYGGVIPTRAHEHHQRSIAGVVQKALTESASKGKIDLVCATWGPGMAGSLCVGLDFAKAMSLSWDVPFVGVHHMLGHLLVPRLDTNGQQPEYPFITLLVSGGHTMLVLSSAVDKHEILCDTIDIAVGDSLDKTARELGIRGNMIAKEMESFIKEEDRDFLRASTSDSKPMKLPRPLRNQNGRMNVQAFSFSPFLTAVRQHLTKPIEDYSVSERRWMAYQVQESTFDHLITKVNLTLKLNAKKLSNVKHFVCSGGVGANMRLRERLETELAHKFQSINYPKLEHCTDNAVMIGWAAIELHESLGLTTSLSVAPVRKWPLNEILQMPGWLYDTKKNL
ncbi:putative protease QRI7 [Kluyveromyces marxianus]|nr:putative protease QRI7 [Kluyveromyces marxianus]